MTTGTPLPLRLMTYNTHLFGSEVQQFMNSFLPASKQEIVYYEDEARVDALCSLVNSWTYDSGSSPDVICFQEVWDDDLANRLKEGLKDAYPNSYLTDGALLDDIGAIVDAAPNIDWTDPDSYHDVFNHLSKALRALWNLGKESGKSVTRQIQDVRTNWPNPQKAVKLFGSGLLYVAKKDFTIRGTGFTSYPGLQDVDAWARKGLAKVKFQNGDYQFAIFNTHMQTGENQNWTTLQSHLALMLKQAVNYDHPFFIAGDFNLKGEIGVSTGGTTVWSPNWHYACTIGESFANQGIVDSWLALYGPVLLPNNSQNPTYLANQGFTSDNVNNTLTPKFKNDPLNAAEDTDQVSKAKRIDYQLFMPNTPQNGPVKEDRTTVAVKSAATISNYFKYASQSAGATLDISDHYPIVADYELTLPS